MCDREETQGTDVFYRADEAEIDLAIFLLGTDDGKRMNRTAEEQFQDRNASALKTLKCDDLRRLVVMIEALALTKNADPHSPNRS